MHLNNLPLKSDWQELLAFLKPHEIEEIEGELAAIEAEMEATSVEAKAERCKASLAEFLREGWHVLEPTTPLVWNWHIDAICDHVQAVLEDWMQRQRWEMQREKREAESRRQSGRVTLADLRFPASVSDLAVSIGEEPPLQRIQNLLVNVPPGTAKSRIVSVFAPAWMWLHWPSWRSIFLSANPAVALRDSTYCRDLIESDWYQSWFKPTWRLRKDQNAKSDYWNTAGGTRRASGWFAKITGGRADALFVDDPHDADEQNLTPDNLHRVSQRWDSAIRNRVNSPDISVRIGIMQRLAEMDWSGHVLAQGGWDLLCLPQIYEPERLREPGEDIDYARGEYPAETPIGWRDPRTTAGALLFPARWSQEALDTERAALGSYGFAGQQQQRPAPPEGGVWKRRWWRFWIPAGADPSAFPPVRTKLPDGDLFEHPQVPLPTKFDLVLQSWDMSFTDTKTSAYAVGHVWALSKSDRFLLDEERDKMDFPAALRAFRRLTKRHPKAETKLVENKANGPAIISTLRGEISGIIAVNPEGDKFARAQAEAPTLEAGNLYLPHPSLAPWVDDFILEAATFPNGTYKDRVDASSQALMRIRKFVQQRDSQKSARHSTSGKALFGKR
jgi:predicted phage terminase large subunit-like protein